MGGVGKGRKFYLIDSEGKKLGLPSVESIPKLIERITQNTGSVSAKDVLMINLTPMPRYQSICCVEQSHGLQGDDSPGTLNTLLRDVGVYMGRNSLLNRPDQLDVVVSPMNVVGPFAFHHSHTSKDNVHPTLGLLTSLACAILLVRKKSRFAWRQWIAPWRLL